MHCGASARGQPMAAVPTWRFLGEEIVVRVTREGLRQAVAYLG